MSEMETYGPAVYLTLISSKEMDMPIQRATAKKLVSETEYKLVDESFAPSLGALSDKALLQRLERARKARDKYHTMAERQRSKAEAGGKAGSSSLKDVMSKERIFEETLARYERQTSKTGLTASSSGQQAAAPAKSRSARGAVGKTASGMKAGVNTAAQSLEGKKTAGKGGAQAVSKASVKMAKKAAAKTGAKPDQKTGKGTGGTMKGTPRGRHGALTPNTNLH